MLKYVAAKKEAEQGSIWQSITNLAPLEKIWDSSTPQGVLIETCEIITLMLVNQNQRMTCWEEGKLWLHAFAL